MLSEETIMGKAVTRESAVRRKDDWQVLSVERIMGKCCQEKDTLVSAVSREDNWQCCH